MQLRSSSISVSCLRCGSNKAKLRNFIKKNRTKQFTPESGAWLTATETGTRRQETGTRTGTETETETGGPVELAVCQAVVGVVVVVAGAAAQSFNYTLDGGARGRIGGRNRAGGRERRMKEEDAVTKKRPEREESNA